MADRFTVFVRDDARCKATTPPARLILYALASRCDAKGYCWPSVEQIVEDTGLNRATIYRAMKQIRDVLTVDAPGYKHSNSYIFPYQRKSSHAIGKQDVNNVDNLSPCATGVAVCDKGVSQCATRGVAVCDGGSRSVRPEEEIEDKQEESLSLMSDQKHVAGVDKYDGMRKPRSREETETIKRWCWEAYLDKAHTDEFLRINRLARWKCLDGATSVKDLIEDFVMRWKSEDADGWIAHWRARHARR